MPDSHVRYTYYIGQKGFDGLTAYVLTEDLRARNVEFDEFQTALDMTSLEFRTHMFVEQACIDAFDVEPDIEWHSLSQLLLQSLKKVNPDYQDKFISMAICDRDRLFAYLGGLKGDKKKALGSLGLKNPSQHWKIPGPEDEHINLRIFSKQDAIIKEMSDIVSERVKVTVISKGRVITMAQATGGDGAPLETRRYKGGTNVNGVSLGECKLHKSGLMIIRKYSGNIPATEKVTEVKNELTGHVVKLTETAETVAKGETAQVITVAHDATYVLTGADHKKSWTVSVEEEKES